MLHPPSLSIPEKAQNKSNIQVQSLLDGNNTLLQRIVLPQRRHEHEKGGIVKKAAGKKTENALQRQMKMEYLAPA
jgi:hypothetical protein